MFDDVIISDTHLGHKFSNVKLLKSFLKEISEETKNLYLVGDIFDFWKESYNPAFVELFKPFKKIIYLPGNHDKEMLCGSLFTPWIKKEVAIDIEGFKLFLIHGDDYDPSFGSYGGIIETINNIVYKISCFVNFDIQSVFHFLTECYYEYKFSYFEQKVKENLIDKNFNYLIVGHTHCPGIFKIGGLKVFNLGSWLTKPYAFFVKDNKYAFFKITRNHLLPQEEDYHNFR